MIYYPNNLRNSQMENSHSGRVHHLGKVAAEKSAREFESLILRQENLVSESTHLHEKVVRLRCLKLNQKYTSNRVFLVLIKW